MLLKIKITQQHGGGAIRYPVNSRRGGTAVSLWTEMVNTKKPWDHKWQLV